jgi:hypothetical protein
MNRRNAFLLRAAFLVPAVVVAATAGAAAGGPGEVILGNEIVFRLRVPAGGLTLQQRGDLLQERLNEVLAITDLNENDVTVLPTRYGPTIYVRGKKLLTVDNATAEASGMKPAPLARAWARRLAAVLPEVNVRLPGGGPAPAKPTATPVAPAAPATAPAAEPSSPEPAPPPAENP